MLLSQLAFLGLSYWSPATNYLVPLNVLSVPPLPLVCAPFPYPLACACSFSQLHMLKAALAARHIIVAVLLVKTVADSPSCMYCPVPLGKGYPSNYRALEGLWVGWEKMHMVHGGTWMGDGRYMGILAVEIKKEPWALCPPNPKLTLDWVPLKSYNS